MEYVRELDTRAAGTAATQSALKVHRLTFMEAAMLVVGSTIGSGVLGLAYASRLAGWPVPFVWLVVAGIFSGISMLYVAETALRTQEPLQLSGLTEKYVGRIGSWLIFFSVGATSFCSLIAYTAGCGRILSECTGLTPELAGILFAAAATVVVWGGLKVTGVAEKFLSLGMIIMLLLLAGASVVSARVPLADIFYTHWAHAVPVFNIAVFCYAVQYIVPELARGFTHAPQKLVPSILTGMGISFLILASVPLSVFLMLPVAEITGSSVSLVGTGPAAGYFLFPGQCLCLLRDADVLLGYFRKLFDQYGKPPAPGLGRGCKGPCPVPGRHRYTACFSGVRQSRRLCQRLV